MAAPIKVVGRSWQNIDFILCEHNLNSHDRTVWHYKEKIDRALRVIFRIIRVLLSILRDSVAYTLTHLVIMPESYYLRWICFYHPHV